MYHELIFHLDLCILAYHQYTQALIWPFDPYYEHMSAVGTSRRDTFMNHVRSTSFSMAPPANNNVNHLYHGPGNTHAWRSNDALDPIIQRYDRLYPWYPAFCCPEVGSWLFYKIPARIVDPIAEVHVSAYQPAGGDPNNAGVANVVRVSTRPGAGAGNDRLYCFEGGTGRINDTPSSWSLMGCVLDRTTPAGYDVHIVFRGSRSGSGGRAANHGLREKGNPDWVTDMDFRNKVRDADFSRRGEVCRGFSRAIKTSMPTLMAALDAIQTRRGAAPQNIFVTGHSLGGALAANFAAAVGVGNRWGPYGGGNDVPAAVRAWPWRNMRLITFSSPVVGSYQLQEEFNSKIFARRVWLGEDPVTTGNFGYHVGSPVWLSNSSSNALYYSKKVASNVFLGGLVGAIGAAATLWHHEPMHIRDCLYKDAHTWGDDLANVVGDSMTHADFPWKVYTSFRNLATANQNSLTRPALQAILSGFQQDLSHYITAFSEVMSHSDAYKTYFLKDASRDARRQAAVAARNVLGTTQRDAPHEVARKVAEAGQAFTQSFDGFGKHVVFGMILSEWLGNASDRAARFFPLTGLLSQDSLQNYLI